MHTSSLARVLGHDLDREAGPAESTWTRTPSRSSAQSLMCMLCICASGAQSSIAATAP